MDTLRDFIDADLAVLSIGINPSLHAVRAGFPFAFPRNRFWPALNASSLVSESFTPGIPATERLLKAYHFGFTDVVKLPSASASALRAKDYADAAPLLVEKIRLATPSVLWFHGKTAIDGFCRYLDGGRRDSRWGLQDFDLFETPCFVSPNPSPANAGYSLARIVASYDELADYLNPS